MLYLKSERLDNLNKTKYVYVKKIYLNLSAFSLKIKYENTKIELQLVEGEIN